MHNEYILTFILEKKMLCLLFDFNQFYEERYLKFSVSKNRSIFFFFFDILNFFDKHV